MNVEKQQMQEKLVELLQHDNCPLFMVFGDKVDVLADYLIAHGVTVQEWISVKDRLPEKNTTVLASTDNGIVFQRLYAYDGWDLWEGNEVNVTHWMPLPEPPAH